MSWKIRPLRSSTQNLCVEEDALVKHDEAKKLYWNCINDLWELGFYGFYCKLP